MATIVASPNPVSAKTPVVISGEGFANATEVTVEVVNTGFKAEIVSSANGNFASDAIADHATGTLTGTNNPNDTETLTIGSQVYTLRTGTGTLGVNEIRIGAALTNTLDNIKAAVNGDKASEGVTFGLGTVRNASAFAAQKTGTTIVFFARAAGTAGNSVATTETLTNLSWGGGTLTGGAAAGARAMLWTPEQPGTYTISATDGTNSATTTLVVFSI